MIMQSQIWKLSTVEEQRGIYIHITLKMLLCCIGLLFPRRGVIMFVLEEFQGGSPKCQFTAFQYQEV